MTVFFLLFEKLEFFFLSLNSEIGPLGPLFGKIYRLAMYLLRDYVKIRGIQYFDMISSNFSAIFIIDIIDIHYIIYTYILYLLS